MDGAGPGLPRPPPSFAAPPRELRASRIRSSEGAERETGDSLNQEALSLFGTGISREEYIAASLDRAAQRGVIDSDEHRSLAFLLAEPPGPERSGLDPLRYEQFLAVTSQHIGICLQHREFRRPGFVNGALQAELDRRAESSPEAHGWRLLEISDPDRRGVDRTKTFGQVKSDPGNPDDPSFFGGTWVVARGEESRRIVFLIHAEAAPGATTVAPLPEDDPDASRIRSMVSARGPAHWEVQIEPSSPLGLWIARLAGSQQIGQLRGQIPLGVLSEAVKRALVPLGLTHMLLGPSRRDPPEKSWHTGRFLERIGDDYRFQWTGFAFDAEDRLVTARTQVELHARIVADLALGG